MKNIKIYDSEKYKNEKYQKVQEHIYKTEDTFLGEEMYVTSLSFEQEPELGEGDSPRYISQYPLEDILDKYLVVAEDFYEKENEESFTTCYQEFSGKNIENVRELLEIVGKHVYNKEIEKDGEVYVDLVIE